MRCRGVVGCVLAVGVFGAGSASCCRDRELGDGDPAHASMAATVTAINSVKILAPDDCSASKKKLIIDNGAIYTVMVDLSGKTTAADTFTIGYKVTRGGVDGVKGDMLCDNTQSGCVGFNPDALKPGADRQKVFFYIKTIDKFAGVPKLHLSVKLGASMEKSDDAEAVPMLAE